MNITNDSFTDDGLLNKPEKIPQVYEAASKLDIDFLDIGCVSTKPNFTPVSTEDELKRLNTFMRFKNDNFHYSIDSFNPIVAHEALENNFLVVNDISGAKESFAELSEFLTRFPDSQYASYAKQRNIYLRNMIARNELSAADYYISIGAHVAAIRRAKYVIENIPNSSEGYRALKILEKSYKALGYQELYDDIKKIINLNYSQ